LKSVKGTKIFEIRINASRQNDLEQKVKEISKNVRDNEKLREQIRLLQLLLFIEYPLGFK
jgi:uncharacterized protein YeeX (DUF496 family)